MQTADFQSETVVQKLFTKVPEITIYFWIVKILTTALGESTSDYLVSHMNPVFAVALGGFVFCLALVLQFNVGRYIAWVYWFTVAMVAIFGTMAADVMHIGLGVPYLFSTIFFAFALIVIFIIWFSIEKTLSIHSIYTRRREVFYWATVLSTFALGTAVGDMTASTFGLGYLYSGILFIILFVIVAIGSYVVKDILDVKHHRQSRNAVFIFWFAYILTRPLGASFADWFGKPYNVGGLGWGDGTVSFILTILILCFVVFLIVTKKDIKREDKAINI